MREERQRHRRVNAVLPTSSTSPLLLRRRAQSDGDEGGGCAATEFCRLKTGTCGEIVNDAGIEGGGAGSSTSGNCFAIPESCPDKSQPVCGCDGNTYGSPCLATMAGQSLAFKRSCDAGDDGAGEDDGGGAAGANEEGAPCVVGGGGASTGALSPGTTPPPASASMETLSPGTTSAPASAGMGTSSPGTTQPPAGAGMGTLPPGTTQPPASASMGTLPPGTTQPPASASMGTLPPGTTSAPTSTIDDSDLDVNAASSSSSTAPSPAGSVVAAISSSPAGDEFSEADTSMSMSMSMDDPISFSSSAPSPSTSLSSSSSSSSLSLSPSHVGGNTIEAPNATTSDANIVDAETTDAIPANVNSRAMPCTGPEGTGLVGYTALQDLLDDILDYQASFITPMPTYSPTVTSMPSTETRSPTYNPTEVDTSWYPPTDVPTSDGPTYAPITYRPTEFPTTAMRVPLEPTRSPAPTIIPKIVGSIASYDEVNGTMANGTAAAENGVDSLANYYINGTNQLNMTAFELENDGGFDMDGDGVVSEGEQFSDPEETGGDARTLSPTVTISPLFAMFGSTLPPGTTPPPEGVSMGTSPPGTTQPPASASMGTLPPGTTQPPGGTSMGTLPPGTTSAPAGASMGTLPPGTTQPPASASMETLSPGTTQPPASAIVGTLPPGTTSAPASASVGTLPPGTTQPPASASMGTPPPGTTSAPTLSLLPTFFPSGTTPGNTLDAFMDDRRQRRRREQDQDEGSSLSLTLGVSDSTGAPDATVANLTASSAAASVAAGGSSKVVFQICPGTQLLFEDKFSLVESTNETSTLVLTGVKPLVLETPARHPIEIICLQSDENRTGETKSSSGCVMSGGSVHILIEHSGTAIDTVAGGDEFKVDQQGQPISIIGITFRGATNSSILMNDPRGNITFKNCTWEDNVGEATMIIDGRYNATITDDLYDDDNDEVGEEEEEDLEPLYPDEPLVHVDDGTDDLFIDFDNPDDMTVAFESTSTSSTMTVHQMTTTVAIEESDLDDDGYTAEMDSPSFSTSSTIANIVETTTIAVDTESEAETETEATLPDGLLIDLGGRLLGLSNDSYIEEDEELSSIGYTGDLKIGGPSMRAMQSPGMEEVVLRSKIFIEGCTFRRGKGNATVLLSSYFGTTTLSEEEQNANLLDNLLDGRRRTQLPQSKLAQSIHLVMKMTTFTSEDVDTSIIENYGGRLQLTNCAFVNNTAESIIRSEEGIVAVVSTEFSGNDLQGNGSQIVLDSESALEKNDDNCLAATNGIMPTGTGDANTNVTLANARSCDGIIAGGVCSDLKTCLAATSVGEQMESCFSDWDDLVVAVRDRPSTKRDFIICPKSTLNAASGPVVIDGSYITIQCGTNWDKDCVISGGESHFKVVGPSKGIQLARLIMSGATESSILALGGKGATLNLQDCEWVKNEGDSAILIHNEQIMKLPSEGPFELIKEIALSPTAAMSVEVIDCIFASNEYSFGAIANIGGTLIVYRSRFVENSALGGDIIVTNYGDSEVRESCFNSASSIAPGTIFVQDGSSIQNKDNFGYQNTAGGYSDGGTCVDVFLEMKDMSCIVDGSMNCNGVCERFTMAACPVDTGDKIRVPYYNQGKESSNLIPIVVAVVVCAFIIFGFIGIVMRRQKAMRRESEGNRSGRAGLCCWKKNGRNRGDSNDEEMENFDDDDNEPL